MRVRHGIMFSVAVIGAMLLASAWAWGQLPPEARVPVHWGVSGEPDGYGSKAEALLAAPLIAALLTALLALLPRIEPRRAHLEQSLDAYVAVWGALVLALAAIHAAIVGTALGSAVNVPAVIAGAVGVLFLVLGRVLGNVRSNFFFGVRTPWTLSSERSWEKTHRLAGRLFLVLGALVLLLALFGNSPLLFAALIGGALTAAVALLVYSWHVWRTDPDRQQA